MILSNVNDITNDHLYVTKITTKTFFAGLKVIETIFIFDID